MNRRRIYRSSNGDTWDLLKDGDELSVLHKPNLASGGRETRYELVTFLSHERHTAQNRALVEMIGTLVERAEASDLVTT